MFGNCLVVISCLIVLNHKISPNFYFHKYRIVFHFSIWVNYILNRWKVNTDCYYMEKFSSFKEPATCKQTLRPFVIALSANMLAKNICLLVPSFHLQFVLFRNIKTNLKVISKTQSWERLTLWALNVILLSFRSLILCISMQV